MRGWIEGGRIRRVGLEGSDWRGRTAGGRTGRVGLEGSDRGGSD